MFTGHQKSDLTIIPARLMMMITSGTYSGTQAWSWNILQRVSHKDFDHDQ
jgi:hypothetical protein